MVINNWKGENNMPTKKPSELMNEEMMYVISLLKQFFNGDKLEKAEAEELLKKWMHQHRFI